MSDRQPEIDSLSSECYSDASEPPTASSSSSMTGISQLTPPRPRGYSNLRQDSAVHGSKSSKPAHNRTPISKASSNPSATRYCQAWHKLRRPSKKQSSLKLPCSSQSRALKRSSTANPPKRTPTTTSLKTRSAIGQRAPSSTAAQLLLRLSRQAYSQLEPGDGYDSSVDSDTDTEDLVKGDGYASVLDAILTQIKTERCEFDAQVETLLTRMEGVKREIDGIKERQRARQIGLEAGAQRGGEVIKGGESAVDGKSTADGKSAADGGKSTELAQLGCAGERTGKLCC